MNRVKVCIFMISMVFLFSSCQQKMEPVVANDVFDRYLWVGDDILDAGPLNLQTLLLLEMAGYPGYVSVENWVDPRNTFTSPPDNYSLQNNIKEHKPDHIFIQAFGVRHAFKDDDFLKNSKLWISTIQNEGKHPVIFYPWFSEVDTLTTINRLDKLVQAPRIWETMRARSVPPLN